MALSLCIGLKILR